MIKKEPLNIDKSEIEPLINEFFEKLGEIQKQKYEIKLIAYQYIGRGSMYLLIFSIVVFLFVGNNYIPNIYALLGILLTFLVLILKYFYVRKPKVSLLRRYQGDGTGIYKTIFQEYKRQGIESEDEINRLIAREVINKGLLQANIDEILYLASDRSFRRTHGF